MAKILIVDDEEMERVWQSSILEEAGHELFFASDGQAALRVFKDQWVDLVVTDLAMPNLNGLRLIQELVAVDPHVRIVAISGVAAEQLDLAEKYGAMRTLYKPVEPEELLKTVTETLGSVPDWGRDPWGL